jgi:Raf kinase inhibitor-like YbhB/YbcL family protein
MRTVLGGLVVLAAVLLSGAGCGEKSTPEPMSGRRMAVTSPAFEEGSPIPVEYTCDGDGVSPPLSWGDIPDGTVSFALIMDDPDARAVVGKTFVHWVVYNIPARAQSMARAVPADQPLPGGAKQGTGTAGVGYRGPCPPKGSTHHYHFKLYALDSLLHLPEGATKEQLITAMKDHVIAQGELVGIYGR